MVTGVFDCVVEKVASEEYVFMVSRAPLNDKENFGPPRAVARGSLNTVIEEARKYLPIGNNFCSEVLNKGPKLGLGRVFGDQIPIQREYDLPYE